MSKWVTKSFSQIARIANGQVNPTEAPYIDYPYVGPENIESHTGRIHSLRRAGELGLISGKYKFDEHVILYSKIRPHLNKVCKPGFKGICSADMYPIWVDPSVIHPDFLFQYLLSPMFVLEAEKRSMRTGMPKINRKDLANIKIAFPQCLDAQRNIASVLGQHDAVADKNRKLLDLKLKQYSWLIKSMIQHSCDKWPHLKARDLFRNKSIKNKCQEVLLSVNQELGVLPRQENAFDKRVDSRSLAGYKFVEEGDFVISLRSFQGGIEYSKYRGIVSPAYTVLETIKTVNSDFYRHFFKSRVFIGKYLSAVVTGIRDGRQVNYADFKTLRIPYPPIEEQERISKVLNLAQHELNLLRKLSDKHRLHKRALMKRMLRGAYA